MSWRYRPEITVYTWIIIDIRLVIYFARRLVVNCLLIEYSSFSYFSKKYPFLQILIVCVLINYIILRDLRHFILCLQLSFTFLLLCLHANSFKNINFLDIISTLFALSQFKLVRNITHRRRYTSLTPIFLLILTAFLLFLVWFW